MVSITVNINPVIHQNQCKKKRRKTAWEAASPATHSSKHSLTTATVMVTVREDTITIYLIVWIKAHVTIMKNKCRKFSKTKTCQVQCLNLSHLSMGLEVSKIKFKFINYTNVAEDYNFGKTFQEGI